MAKLRWLNLAIDYKFDQDDGTPSREVTASLINAAFMQNYASGMDSTVSVPWLDIREALKDATDNGQDHVILADSDFKLVYKEVYACKYNPVHSAPIAPHLYNELDKVKNRPIKEDEALIEAQQKLEADIKHEMEKGLNENTTESEDPGTNERDQGKNPDSTLQS